MQVLLAIFIQRAAETVDTQERIKFLKRVFIEGLLRLDRDPELRTDLIEHVSMKYRECAGLLAEASLL
jgi:hypothetical protein